MRMNLLALAMCFGMLLSQRAAMADDALVEHDGSRGLWLRNESAEVFLASEPRFRVMAFRKIGQTSLMADSNIAETGLRLAFMELEQIKTSFDPGNQPAQVIERSPTRVQVSLKPAVGLQYSVRAELDPQRPRLRLTYDLKNVDQQPRRVACWSLIAYARDEFLVVPFDQTPRTRRKLVLPWWTAWPQPGVQFGRDALLSDASAKLQGNAYKIGIITDAGWIAFVRGSSALVSTVQYKPDEIYPEDGANVTLFQCDNPPKVWCESEQVGPLKQLNPGESVTMTETIELIDLADDTVKEADALRQAIEAKRAR